MQYCPHVHTYLLVVSLTDSEKEFSANVDSLLESFDLKFSVSAPTHTHCQSTGRSKKILYGPVHTQSGPWMGRRFRNADGELFAHGRVVVD